MKKLAMTALAAALAFATAAFADDARHSETTPGTKSASAKPAAKNPTQVVQKMQDNVKKMQPQLDRIAKAKTDDERQKAMAEHLQTMQENIQTLQENIQIARTLPPEALNCPVIEDMGKGGMGKGGTGMMVVGGNQPESSPEHMQQIEKRMDMLQDMMKMMIERMAPLAAK